MYNTGLEIYQIVLNTYLLVLNIDSVKNFTKKTMKFKICIEYIYII